MKTTKVIAMICQNFADMVECDENYNDIYSLQEAISIINKLGNDNIEKEDIEGRMNPHLDYVCDEWETLCSK